MDCLQALVWCLNNKDTPQEIKDDLLKIYDTFLLLVEIGYELEKNARKTED